YLPLLCGGVVRLTGGSDAIQALSLAMDARDSQRLVKLTPGQLNVVSVEMGRDAASQFGKVLVIGGEALKWEDLSDWRRNAVGSRLINEYGPTETVVGCSVYEAGVEGGERGGVPIGKPISNTRLYVMCKGNEVAPVCVPGELYVGGAGL